MSYNGTVFCRDCGGKGHNKRTCPELTSYLKRMAEINPDSYEAAQYRKRVGIDRDGIWEAEEDTLPYFRMQNPQRPGSRERIKKSPTRLGMPQPNI